MSEKFQQTPQMLVADLETLKVMADSLRLKLIEALSHDPITVKQLAKLVGVPQSKLYYHVGLLEKQGLITIVDTQIVSGIVEKWYQSTAESYRIDHKLFKAKPDEETAYGLIMTVFDATLDEIRAAVDSGLITLDEEVPNKGRLALSKSTAFLTPEQAESIREQLYALHEQFTEYSRETNREGKRAFSLLTGFYPRHYDGHFEDEKLEEDKNE